MTAIDGSEWTHVVAEEAYISPDSPLCDYLGTQDGYGLWPINREQLECAIARRAREQGWKLTLVVSEPKRRGPFEREFVDAVTGRPVTLLAWQLWTYVKVLEYDELEYEKPEPDAG